MTDLNSREKPRNIISKHGTMNLMSDKPYWWVAPSAVFIVLGIAACITLFILDSAFALLGIFVGLILILPAEFMFLSARTGRACRYEADDEKLTVFRRDKTEEFYYCETLGVTFEPFSMMLGDVFDCGYKVIIHTKYKDIVRYYAFGGSHGKNPPQETPFWILVMNLPEDKDPGSTPDMISGENYYENAQKKEP